MELKDVKTAEECRMVKYENVKDLIIMIYKDIEEEINKGNVCLSKLYNIDDIDHNKMRIASSFFLDKGYRVSYMRGMNNSVHLDIRWDR